MRFLTLLSLSAAARQAIAVTYTAADGAAFSISPGIDYYGGDLTLVWTNTLDQCLDQCSVTAGCIFVSYIGPGWGPCYMKNKFYVANIDATVTGAKLIASATAFPSSTITSSASLSSTSSATSSISTSSTRTSSAFVCTSSASGWELIGDLQNGATTKVGQNLTNVLEGQDSAVAKDGGYTPTGPRGSAACQADTCCIWSYIASDLQAVFLNPNGTCTSLARGAVRLGFHDAAGWSKPNALAGMDFGGADGSIVLSSAEAARSDNLGLAAIITQMQQWQATYGVGMADLIQFASNLAAVTCPLGSRVRTWVGRIDSSTPAPTGLLPHVTDSTDTILCLFSDKTISYSQLAALMGAHSTSQQFFVDPTKAGQPQDDTPGIWDQRYYAQHLAGGTVPSGVFQFASDLALANDTRTKDPWTTFAITGRSIWAESYATAYVRLSMLGVNNMNNLTECSHVLPQAVLSFPLNVTAT